MVFSYVARYGMALNKVIKLIRRFVEGTWLYQFLIPKKKRSSDYVYLTADEIIEYNQMATNIQGLLRDRAGLESAVTRPKMACYYEGADIVRQAVLLVDGVCMTHAFIDGNKRTALIACTAFLYLNGFKLKGVHRQLSKEIETLVVERDVERFALWLRGYIQPL